VPQERGQLERYEPELRHFDSDPELRSANAAFNQRRHDSMVRNFLAEYVPGAQHAPFEKDYMRGVTPTGTQAPEHQRKLSLKRFDDDWR
jgi:uncharacterized protein DUF6065